MWTPDICIYHDPCDDGFGSAWAVWRKWGEAVDFRPTNYGLPVPDEAIDGKHVLISDFSFKPDVLEALAARAASIVILDHHKTAESDLIAYRVASAVTAAGLAPVDEWIAAYRFEDSHPARRSDFGMLHVAPNVLAMFDMNRSGAMLTWRFCFPGEKPPQLGGAQRPIVVNVCNFARGEPCLLSYDDARTLFHEFGHALHQMLSDVTYGFISGTSVARDFVELPSQLYEHWLEVPQVLETHARHWQTGAAMPGDLLQRLLGAATYDQGFATVEFIASALVDLEFHNGPAPAHPMQKEAEVLAGLGMPRAIRMRHATPHFAHVFSGDGYSSGYYSYMWSEVMDADAFAAFEEAGDAFDPATAARLERFILSAGGSEEAEALYTRFRGRMPGVEALLKGRGLVEPA